MVRVSFTNFFDYKILKNSITECNCRYFTEQDVYNAIKYISSNKLITKRCYDRHCFLGNYYSKKTYPKQYETDELTNDIINLKNYGFPKTAILAMFDYYIKRTFTNRRVIVTGIPDKPDKNDNKMNNLLHYLERFCNVVPNAYGHDANCNIIFRNDILQFRAGTESMHTQNTTIEWRRQNIQKNLLLAEDFDPSTLENYHILILDDIVTTGTTLSQARQLIQKAKSQSGIGESQNVLTCAIAHTYSDYNTRY